MNNFNFSHLDPTCHYDGDEKANDSPKITQLIENAKSSGDASQIFTLYYNCSKNENSQFTRDTIHSCLSSTFQTAQKECTAHEKEVDQNFISNFSKVKEFLDKNERLKRYSVNYYPKVYNQSNPEHTTFQSMKEYVSIKNSIIHQKSSQCEFLENLKEIQNILKENIEQETVERQVSYYEHITTIYDRITQISTKKNLKRQIIPFLNKRKEYTYSLIQSSFQQNFTQGVISVEEKVIQLRIFPDNLAWLKSISEKFPEMIISLLQWIYDHFFSYFSNMNYYLKSDGNTHPDFSRFQFDLISKRDEFNCITHFTNLISCLEKFIPILIQISRHCALLSDEKYGINYDILYCESIKHTSNCFILALSYSIQQSYEMFKKNLKEFPMQIQDEHLEKVFRDYQAVCTLISDNYNVCKSFKFFNESDFNFNENLSKLNLNRKGNNSGHTDLILKLRDLIKSSHEETMTITTIETSGLDLVDEIFIDSGLKQQWENGRNSKICWDKKLEELDAKFVITPSFKAFIIEIFNIIQKEEKSKDEMIQKIMSILYSMYNEYYRQIEFSAMHFSDILLLHNNIEMFLFCLNFFVLFEPKKQEKNFIALCENLLIFFQNFSSDLIFQIISNFISQLTSEMSTIQTFEDIHFDKNYREIEKMISNSQELIHKFFNSFKDFASQRDLLFNLNYVISLFFDMINKKILCVTDFNINDIKVILSLCKGISPRLKKNFEEITTTKNNLDLKIEFTSLLEMNQKYKKFEEILFILNANLKEIRNFIIQSNYQMHIDPNEMIELIKSIFDDNANRAGLLKFINEKLF